MCAVAELYSLCLIHGCCPKDTLRGTFKPIHETKGTTSENYRGITFRRSSGVF